MSSFLDPVLGWVLVLHPAFGILIISFIISLLITLAMKVFTDQSLMKDLKEEQKELQKELKTLKNNPKKMAKVNAQFMETNMKYMSHSMRPTLFTFIPIIIIFGWLNANLAYYPLQPNSPFYIEATFNDGVGAATLLLPEGMMLLDSATKQVIDNKVSWEVSGTQGEYIASIEHRDQTYEKEIIISSERQYAPIDKEFSTGFLFFKSSDEGTLNKITLNNQKVIPFSDVPVLKNLPWISGWGWLGVYIFFQLIFSLSMRKALNVY